MDFNLQREWTSVGDAPLTFVGTAIVVGVLIWAFVQFIYKSRIERLRQDVESEQAESARLRGRVSEYENKLSGATPDEAGAEIADLRARLDQIAPRRLSDEAKAHLVAKAMEATGAISIMQDAATPGAGGLAEDLRRSFYQAGWQVRTGVIHAIPASSGSGLFVWIDQPPQNQLAVNAALSALSEAGLEYDRATSQRFVVHPDPVDLQVFVTFSFR